VPQNNTSGTAAWRWTPEWRIYPHRVVISPLLTSVAKRLCSATERQRFRHYRSQPVDGVKRQIESGGVERVSQLDTFRSWILLWLLYLQGHGCNPGFFFFFLFDLNPTNPTPCTLLASKPNKHLEINKSIFRSAELITSMNRRDVHRQTSKARKRNIHPMIYP
jgi:hypothetical protein